MVYQNLCRYLLPQFPRFGTGLVLACCLLGRDCRGRSQPVALRIGWRQKSAKCWRIVLVPFQTPDSSDKAQIVSRQLGAALRQQGRFEVMMLQGKDVPELSDAGSWQSNRIDPAILRELSRRYNCDAVLIGRIDRWQPYDPVAIGLQVHLIHVGSGAIVWSAGGDFDSRTQPVQDALSTWWDHTHGSGQSQHQRLACGAFEPAHLRDVAQ